MRIDSITTALAALNATRISRGIDTTQSVNWARAMYRLSRAIEIEGYLSDTRFLREQGLTRDQIRQARLFAERFPDTQLLERVLDWIVRNGKTHYPTGFIQISRSDIIRELCCTGVPIDQPRCPDAYWQSTGHWGSDGRCYYDTKGPAL